MADDLLSSGSTVSSSTLSGTTSTSSKTSAAASQDQLSSDLNFFLTMLTTQLKNQDPTAPLDTNQFTQQIAQYSSVQQQVITNDNLEKLLAANQQSSLTTAVSYMGHEVETAGSTGEVYGGQGAFSYILPKTAATVKLTIKDSQGSVVYEGAGTTKSGRNLVVWDGINSSTGMQEPDGIYTISVVATDPAGKPITAETRSVAIVSGVETTATGDIILTTANNAQIDYEDILAVRDPTRADLYADSAA